MNLSNIAIKERVHNLLHGKTIPNFKVVVMIEVNAIVIYSIIDKIMYKYHISVYSIIDKSTCEQHAYK